MIMSTKVSIVLLTTLSLFAVGCSKDPQVAKKEYFDKGNTYFEQKKYPKRSLNTAMRSSKTHSMVKPA